MNNALFSVECNSCKTVFTRIFGRCGQCPHCGTVCAGETQTRIESKETEPIIKDSGQRREAPTGSVRDRAVGKGRFDLLPMYALEEVAKHFEDGANKYGERNWEKGQPLSWYADSLLRHVAKILRGDVDEPHIRAAAWNALCLLDTKRRIELGLLPVELDDIPKSPVPLPIFDRPKTIAELYDSIISKEQQTLDGTYVLDKSTSPEL